MYWIMMSERSDEYELRIDGLPPIVESLGLCFCDGNYIPGELPIIEISYCQHPEERKTDNLVAATKLGLVVNDKVRAVFSALDIRNVQYFPARLEEVGSADVDESYSIANIVGRSACVDKEMSELELFDDGEIQFIDKLSLDLNPDADCGHIFRLAEFLPLMVISDELKNALTESGITGFTYHRPEEFSL